MWASLIAQLVKNLPARQETPVRFLDQEDPLEKVGVRSTLFGTSGWDAFCVQQELAKLGAEAVAAVHLLVAAPP